jgi:hypothetical protein
MEHVIVEGSYATPKTPEAVLAGDLADRPCFDFYRSHPVVHFLSIDGTQICCVFTAPDAESVRRALKQIDTAPPNHVYAASIEGGAGDLAALQRRATEAMQAGALVLVERSFAAPVDFAAVQALEDRGSWCLDLHGISFLATFFARHRRRMICLYAAPDSEAVRLTNSKLEMPHDRVWAARVFGPASAQAEAQPPPAPPPS